MSAEMPDTNLDTVRDTLAHRLELYDEDATVPVKAVDLQVLLDGLTVARSAPVGPVGYAVKQKLVDATYALDAIRDLANAWLFPPGTGSRPSSLEQATEDRIAQVLLQVLGNP